MQRLELQIEWARCLVLQFNLNSRAVITSVVEAPQILLVVFLWARWNIEPSTDHLLHARELGYSESFNKHDKKVITNKVTAALLWIICLQWHFRSCSCRLEVHNTLSEVSVLPCHHQELVYLFAGERTLWIPQLLLQLGLVPVICLTCSTHRGNSLHTARAKGEETEQYRIRYSNNNELPLRLPHQMSRESQEIKLRQFDSRHCQSSVMFSSWMCERGLRVKSWDSIIYYSRPGQTRINREGQSCALHSDYIYSGLFKKAAIVPMYEQRVYIHNTTFPCCNLSSPIAHKYTYWKCR